MQGVTTGKHHPTAIGGSRSVRYSFSWPAGLLERLVAARDQVPPASVLPCCDNADRLPTDHRGARA